MKTTSEREKYVFIRSQYTRTGKLMTFLYQFNILNTVCCLTVYFAQIHFKGMHD